MPKLVTGYEFVLESEIVNATWRYTRVADDIKNGVSEKFRHQFFTQRFPFFDQSPNYSPDSESSLQWLNQTSQNSIAPDTYYALAVRPFLENDGKTYFGEFVRTDFITDSLGKPPRYSGLDSAARSGIRFVESAGCDADFHRKCCSETC